MSKFTISTDSCVDRFKSTLEKNNIYCITLKRILNGTENAELYDSVTEYEQFYESLERGELPTTSQLNPAELVEHYNTILEKETGDIIHISLSGGLSNTYGNCAVAAVEVNETLRDRRVYVIDSLSATAGMAMLVDKLIELRDSGISAEVAVKIVEDMRDHQQVWAAVGNLFHLKRGGRISGLKATIGTMLNVKPILTITDKGKLVIERTVKGKKKSIEYLADKLEQLVKNKNIDYNKRVYIVHSAAEEEFDLLKQTLQSRFGDINLVEGMIGPIIGTHVGTGAVALIFEGQLRQKS